MDRIVTPAQLASMVKNGTVRFFYLSANQQNNGAQGQFGGGPQGSNAASGGPQGGNNSSTAKLDSTNDDLVQWVTNSCTVVPSNLWQTSTTSKGGGAGGMQLYDCATLKS